VYIFAMLRLHAVTGPKNEGAIIAIVLVFRGFEWALGRGACVPVILGSNLLDGAGFGVHWLVFAGPTVFTEATFRFSDLSSGDDR